ncbi:MAG: hypothetical protein K6T17_00745 [Fimbriimonadales bacterium]|nr:hypothetical protein [Fimbriimonadales bacterium]
MRECGVSRSVCFWDGGALWVFTGAEMPNFRRDVLATLLGSMAFLIGLGLLLYTFIQSVNLFLLPPDQLIKRENPDVAEVARSFADVMARIGLLLVQSVVGAVITWAGFRLYGVGRRGSPEGG